MQKKRIERLMVTVWRIRVVTVYAILLVSTSYLFTIRSRAWAIFALIWSILFLIMYLFYYPIKYNRTSYYINNNILIVTGGVIYTRVNAIPLANIQFVANTSTILMRYLKLNTVVIYGAGGRIYIPGLKVDESIALSNKLRSKLK